MSAVKAVKTSILCLFLFGLLMVLAGHRYKTQKLADNITWQDVHTELEHVEQARLELFSALQDKITR